MKMGSLVGKNKTGLILTLLAAILLLGSLSPPTWAGTSIESQKVRLLEFLGLNSLDPAVVKAAQEAHTLYAVDVVPDEDSINVVLQLSDLPTYKSSIYQDNRRLVVDLSNTINLSSSSEFTLGEEDPIRKVCNSQFRVEPSLVSRVVLSLDEEVTPEIENNGNNLVISVPTPKQMVAEQSVKTEPTETYTKESVEDILSEDPFSEEDSIPDEIVSIPAIEVETKGPTVDFMVAQAPIVSDATTDESFPLEDRWEDVEPEEASSNKEDSGPVVAPASEDVVAEVPVEEPEPVTLVETEKSAEENSAELSGDTEAEEVVAEVPVEEPEPVTVVETEKSAEENSAELSEDSEATEQAPVILSMATDAKQAEPAEAAVALEEQEIEQTAQADLEHEALNEMFSDRPKMMESAVVAEADPVAPSEENVEDEIKALKEMLSKMAETMENQEPTEPVLPEPGTEAAPAVPEQNAPEEERITLTFRDADLSAVLDILARKGKLNILAGKDVRGSVTLRLVDIPLDVALNAILNVNGYGYVRTDNIVRVVPLSQLGQVVETVTETHMLSYADAGNTKTTLQGFLSPNGKIETDGRTNMLIITDVPNNVKRIGRLIPQIDKRVQQVLIEVLILDSVLSDDADLGISWGLRNEVDRSFNTREVEGTALRDQINVTLPVAADALTLTFGTLLGDFNLNAFIEASVTDSDSKVLANPRILTLNNEMATIEIVEEFPYSDVTQTSSGGQLSNITFKEIGTKLEVKPQITHDEHVILWIAPEQNSIAGTTTTGVPRVDTRRAETTLIVKNHETIVLGGLRENRNVTGVTKVPLLGDIPGVKYAFRSVSSDKTDTELLVFITVHIVESMPLIAEQEIKFGELANLPRQPNASIEFVR